ALPRSLRSRARDPHGAISVYSASRGSATSPLPRGYVPTPVFPFCNERMVVSRVSLRVLQFTPLHQATMSGFTNVYLASDDTAQHNTVLSSSRSAQHAIIGRRPMATHGTVDGWLDRVKNEYKF